MSVRRPVLARAAVLASTLLAASPAAGRAQAIVNGSFEDPAAAPNSLTEITATGIPGWTGNSIAGVTHEYIVNGNIPDSAGRFYGVTPFGRQYLGLNAIYRRSFRSIESQVVRGLTVGQTYALTLSIANLDGARDPNIGVTVEPNAAGTGNPLASATFTAPIEGPFGIGYIDFVPETLTFTAVSDVIDLNIANQSFTGVMGVDNVSLAAVGSAVVPEPTSLALTSVALVAGGLLVRSDAARLLSRAPRRRSPRGRR